MDLLFAAPWYYPVVLLAAGGVVFWTGNRRLDQTLKRVGIGLGVLGVVWGLVSYLVRTPKERAIAHTKAILVAYQKRDWTGFEGLLDPATTLATYGNREAIVRAAKSSVDDPGVKDLYLLSADADQTQSHVTVTTTIATPLERLGGRPVRSTWQFEYVDMAGAWTLTAITPVSVEDQSADAIVRQLPRVSR